MSDLTENQSARLAALRPFIVAALPALIGQQTPAENPSEPGEAARLSSDQIGEIAITACEIANAIFEVIKAEPTPAESAV